MTPARNAVGDLEQWRLASWLPFALVLLVHGGVPVVASAGLPVDVVIHEVLADPAGTLSGDANCDGVANTSEDEFVEIANLSAISVDISSWTLSDAAAIRHTFGPGTVLAPSEAIVVFGGGMPTFDGSSTNPGAWCLDLPEVAFAVASGGLLAFNNSGGETVTLRDELGVLIDGLSFNDSPVDQSWTRFPDLTIGASFASHLSVSTERQSPGSTTDLMPIPEPGTGAAGLGVLAVLRGIRGRRRRCE